MSDPKTTAVHQAVLLVARLRGATVDEVTNEHVLARDLGFDSLDLAQVVAELEVSLGVDPFRTARGVPQVRTVGDLVALYTRGEGSNA